MPVARRWTAREVRELIANSPLATPRYELVDGELLVTPSPNTRHQLAVVRMIVALNAYLERERIGLVLTSPSDVEVEPESIMQPDVYVIPKDEWRRVDGSSPVHTLLLAVEVLSPSSSRHDRVRKRPLYQRNVPEYWIVDPDARLIERWRTGDDRPELLDALIEWHPPGTSSAFVLDLERYFAAPYDEA